MFESINIQYTNEHLCSACGLTAFARQTLVQDGDDPFEKTSVDELGDRVSDDGRLRTIQRRYDLLVPRGDLFLDRAFLEIGQGYAKEPRGQLQRRIGIIDGRVSPRL